MTAARLLAVAALALPWPAAAQEAVSLEAPRPVRAHLTRLTHADPAVRADAAAALGADDKNAPFLRFERVTAATDAHRAALDAALAPIEARRWARHRDRVKDWAKERRLDLLAEYFALCPEGDAAAAATHLLRVRWEILAEAWPAPAAVRRPDPTAVRPADPVVRLRLARSGADVWSDGWAFDGRRFPMSGPAASGQDWAGSLIAARGPLRFPSRTRGWETRDTTIALVNGRAEVSTAIGLMLVADGDVELVGGPGFGVSIEGSLIVASGSIRAPDARSCPVHASLMCAGGSIELPQLNDEGVNVFHAGGAFVVQPGCRFDKTTRVAEKQPALPYGIRFVTLDEFGVRVEVVDGGPAVAAVEAWSPLARYDVRPGDVIARVGFDATRTADALRRALRRTMMDEAAVFHVVRGGARLTRVVYLDGGPRRP
ncbi:MAG TPA: PDZ domain-containing protein [Urbifossiella sp.]|nr:PDZ domain-containing protein [Urbifossiella sp.]